ncbi:hypothetical protein ACFC58_10180 [Kitasatospora purpeofusca]|uniref:hypothetical protein n=1 Tax=Kitasatospora purpeofusca TaxID=67352 RepID=UPI0035D817B1
MDAKITLALTDPAFPGMREARGCQWLLRHPAVCVLTHEELAGPALGGTTEARDHALHRLLTATGHADLPPAPITLPGPDNGELPVGVWRTHFSPEHERLLQQHHGGLLSPHPDEAARAIGPRRSDAPATSRPASR